ncbi:leiomodin-2a isoform X1 [Synchiropus splendidus]|uniref:leiomodin-2a isoform X1 n=1 Tax=Synchiropus splendidus TaxID=270530 RepID=UPI00237EAE18|nr:leiomodin-2a isoform X1 [Synchiropus splendidus]
MSTFGYQKELKKYEELDEEELLATLSSEELEELERELAELDPDDNVPIGLRQKDQTAKIPTGNFDRDALLKYWEEENHRILEEKLSPEKEEQHDKSRHEGEKANISNADKSPEHIKSTDDRKKVLQKGKKLSSVESKKTTKEQDAEKKDECKTEVQDKKTRPDQTSAAVTPDRASGNPIIIEDALEQVLRDDPLMSEVNLNNIEDVSQETLLRFAEALSSNTHVCVFSLANTHADDRVAFAISKMLCENTSIRNLNIESNFVTGQGILALLAALHHNRTLVELRFHNQRHICGGKVEMEMVRLLRENTTLLKLGYQFDLPGPRMTATSILTRNQDQQRQQRLQQKKEQTPSLTIGHTADTATERKLPKKPPLSSKAAENANKNTIKPTQNPSEPPTRKIAETVKQHEGLNSIKGQCNQRKPKSKKLKNGSNEKESVDILKELKNSLRPSVQKRREEPSHLPLPQRSSRDDLMAAIRGSSIRSLKRVRLPSAPVRGWRNYFPPEQHNVATQSH